MRRLGIKQHSIYKCPKIGYAGIPSAAGGLKATVSNSASNPREGLAIRAAHELMANGNLTERTVATVTAVDMLCCCLRNAVP
jgi:hypothetical protein